MKIAIITVFGTRNFGSFWQAKALGDALKEYGHEVYYFDTKARTKWSQFVKPTFERKIKSLLKLNFKKYKFADEAKKIYLKNLKELNIFDSYEELKCMDKIVFGSDEIWNVRRKVNYEYPVLWGQGIDNNNKYSYAVSINDSNEEDLLGYNFDETLKSFQMISVRDVWSKNCIEKLTEKPVSLVVDPTLLWSKEYYLKKAIPPIKSGYVAIYMFDITKDEFSVIKKFADSQKKRIVNVGSWDDQADENVISAVPFNFFMGADYIFTNTFHGTIFSINYNRPFVVINRENKKKINSTLEQYGLEHRKMIKPDYDKVYDILINDKIDWNRVNSQIENNRNNSREYIADIAKMN